MRATSAARAVKTYASVGQLGIRKGSRTVPRVGEMAGERRAGESGEGSESGEGRGEVCLDRDWQWVGGGDKDKTGWEGVELRAVSRSTSGRFEGQKQPPKR